MRQRLIIEDTEECQRFAEEGWKVRILRRIVLAWLVLVMMSGCVGGTLNRIPDRKAWTCEAMSPIANQVERASYIFNGKVTRIAEGWKAYTVDLDVGLVWKGQIPQDPMRIVLKKDSYMMPYQLGHTYFFLNMADSFPGLRLALADACQAAFDYDNPRHVTYIDQAIGLLEKNARQEEEKPENAAADQHEREAARGLRNASDRDDLLFVVIQARQDSLRQWFKTDGIVLEEPVNW